MSADDHVDESLPPNSPKKLIMLKSSAPKLEVVKASTPPNEWVTPPNFLRGGGSKTSPPQKILANALKAIRHHKHWQGVLRYDALALRVEAAKPLPWDRQADAGEWRPRPWTDHDDNLCTEWIQQTTRVFIGTQIAAAAIQTVAREHSFHPVREYLEKLSWDGTKRLETWCSDYMGAEQTPYTALVGVRWMISAVARIMKPGCKVDCMPIFEGLQGQGKSTVLRRLAEPWFSDTIQDLRNKDTAMSIAGKWIIEFQELEGFKGASVEQLKAFLSRETDRYRPPYGRMVIDSPRQCVFAGTTNQEQYLQDDTGARRFWPISCKNAMRADKIAEVRDQLWAEALVLYNQGDLWWLDTPEAKALAAEEQDARYMTDSWEEEVEEYFAINEEATMAELLEVIAKISPDKVTQTDQKRMTKVLNRVGAIKTRIRVGGRGRRYTYRLKTALSS